MLKPQSHFSRMTSMLAISLACLISANAWASVTLGKPNADCPQFAPKGFPFPADPLVAGRSWHICHKAYSSYVDPVTKTPLWAVEELKGEGLDQDEPRTNDFRPDPNIPRSVQASSQKKDFAGSGYDQGHLAPAADFRAYSADVMSESFYYSNIVPQDAKNNRFAWAKLETFTRQWAQTRGKVYVVTGPIYSSGQALGFLGSSKLAIPTHLFKVVVDFERMDSMAFVLPNIPVFPEGVNSNTKGGGSFKAWEQELSKYQVSIQDVSNWSGLKFHAGLEQAAQDKLNNQKQTMWPTKNPKSRSSNKTNH